MIRSFKSKDAKDIFEGRGSKRWSAILKQLEKRLHILDMASCVDDLKHLPSNHFEALKGDRRGQYSIRVNRQWRLCFKWKNNEAHEVEIVDYHK